VTLRKGFVSLSVFFLPSPGPRIGLVFCFFCFGRCARCVRFFFFFSEVPCACGIHVLLWKKPGYAFFFLCPFPDRRSFSFRLPEREFFPVRQKLSFILSFFFDPALTGLFPLLLFPNAEGAIMCFQLNFAFDDPIARLILDISSLFPLLNFSFSFPFSFLLVFPSCSLPITMAAPVSLYSN